MKEIGASVNIDGQITAKHNAKDDTWKVDLKIQSNGSSEGAVILQALVISTKHIKDYIKDMQSTFDDEENQIFGDTVEVLELMVDGLCDQLSMKPF